MVDVNQPMMVIRKRLSATEGDPPGKRYNPTTDEVESSPDGGTTWYPDPEADPRTNPAGLLPALESEHNCDAAAGMVIRMQQFVTGVFGKTALIGIANTALLMLVAMIPGAGWLFGVALAIASVVVAAGSGVIALSFTETVWEQILCILYLNIGSDGQVTQAQLDTIQAEIEAQCGETVGIGSGLIFKAWGFVGLSNAGVLSADPEADCDDCGCPGGTNWCQTLFEREIESPAGFSVVTDEWGAQGVRFDEGAPGWAWESVPNLNRGTSENATLLLLRRTLQPGNYSHVELECTLDFGTFSTDIRQFTVKIGATTILSQTTDFSDVMIWDGDIDLVGTAVLEIQGVFSYVNPGTSDGGCSLYRMTIGGAGIEP